MINDLFNRTIVRLQEQKDELINYMETDVHVKNFVEKLLLCTVYTDITYSEETLEILHSSALCTMFWELTNYDIKSAVSNKYHTKGDWVYEINMFIGNYIYDDAYFTLKKENKIGNQWSLRNANDEDDIYDINALLAAALENAKYIYSCKGLIGNELRQAMDKGVIASGVVKPI
jgi:hypothetical protein